MSPHPSTSDDSSSDSSATRRRGLLQQIRAVIETFAEIEEEEGGHRRVSGRIDRGSSRIDYEYDVSLGVGLDDRTPSPREPPDCDHSRIERISAKQGETDDAIHTERQEVSDDELVVTADLSGVTGDLDLTLDAEEPAFELTADGETIDRVALQSPNVVMTDVSLNNRILTVRLGKSGGSNGEEGE